MDQTQYSIKQSANKQSNPLIGKRTPALTFPWLEPLSWIYKVKIINKYTDNKDWVEQPLNSRHKWVWCHGGFIKRGGGCFLVHTVCRFPSGLLLFWPFDEKLQRTQIKPFILCHHGEIAQPKCDILRSRHLERGRSSNVNAIRTR